MEVYMNDILRVFLEELNQNQMIEYLSYCLSELITNAKKANTKRVYFKLKKLDISNQADYELGMKSFKSDTLDDINYYLSLQKKSRPLRPLDIAVPQQQNKNRSPQQFRLDRF